VNGIHDRTPVYYLTLILMNSFFLLHSSLSRRDPLVKVCDNIVNEVVKEFSAQLVRSSVDEVVVGHMAVIKSGDWLDDFILETIQPMLPRVVRGISE